MEKILPVIKWSGSKRSQAEQIVSLFPKNINCYFEPFLGGGSILGYLEPQKAKCGDICQPLMRLWKLIKTNPELVANEYEKRWKELQKKGYKKYYEIRSDFNNTKSPHDLLFLSRTCVNGLIRFNNDGNFNNSFHYSRKGIEPSRLRKILLKWSGLIKNTSFASLDYRELTDNAQAGDFVYLDPPYLNTRGRYFGTINFEDLIEYLMLLNKKNIKFALSFDGTRGDKEYTVKLPKELYKRHILLHSGNSTFNKVQNNKIEAVHESLYLNY